MNYLAEIEEQIVERLRSEIPTLHKITTVFNDDELLEAMKLPPSVAVRFSRAENDTALSPTGGERPQIGQARQLRRLYFSIFSIERNLRARNHREPDEYYLHLAEIQDALMGWNPSPSVGCALSGFVMGNQQVLGAINKTDVIYETEFWLTYRTKEPTK